MLKGGKVKRSLLEILVCPICKGALQLTVIRDDDIEVLEGQLNCQKCFRRYLIHEGIPNLLPLELQPPTLQ